MVESYLESNERKKKTKGLTAEEKATYEKYRSDYEKFRILCDSKEWQDCRDFIKDEIYKGLSLAPGDGGDWWLKYCWGLKTFIERVEAHAKKYDEAIKELTK